MPLETYHEGRRNSEYQVLEIISLADFDCQRNAKHKEQYPDPLQSGSEF